MTSKLAKIIGMAAITALSFGKPDAVYAPPIEAGYTYEIHQQLMWEGLAKEQNADLIKTPFVKTPKNKGYCSRYAVVSAKKLFNKDYNSANAWDLKYNNPVVYDFEKEKDVKEAIIEDRLHPGMLVTSKWPVQDIKKYWTYKDKKGFDQMGNPIDATHVVEYAGIGRITDEKILDISEPIFFHKWGKKTERMTQKQLWDKYQLKFLKVVNDKEIPEKEIKTTFPEKYF